MGGARCSTRAFLAGMAGPATISVPSSSGQRVQRESGSSFQRLVKYFSPLFVGATRSTLQSLALAILGYDFSPLFVGATRSTPCTAPVTTDRTAFQSPLRRGNAFNPSFVCHRTTPRGISRPPFSGANRHTPLH